MFNKRIKEWIKTGYTKEIAQLLISFIDKVHDQLGADYIHGGKGEIWTMERLMIFIRLYGRDRYYRPDGRNAEAAAQNQVRDFDCSGLITWSAKQVGILQGSREYNAQMIEEQLCFKIDKSDLQDGDLLFRGTPADHMGMYYGGKTLHAKGTGLGVVLNDELNSFPRAGRLASFYNPRQLLISRTRQFFKTTVGINLDYWDGVKYFDEFMHKTGMALVQIKKP